MLGLTSPGGSSQAHLFKLGICLGRIPGLPGSHLADWAYRRCRTEQRKAGDKREGASVLPQRRLSASEEMRIERPGQDPDFSRGLRQSSNYQCTDTKVTKVQDTKVRFGNYEIHIKSLTRRSRSVPDQLSNDSPAKAFHLGLSNSRLRQQCS